MDTRIGSSSMIREDSMMSTFHAPPLEGRDYVISTVYSPEKYQKKMGSAGTAKSDR